MPCSHVVTVLLCLGANTAGAGECLHLNNPVFTESSFWQDLTLGPKYLSVSLEALNGGGTVLLNGTCYSSVKMVPETNYELSIGLTSTSEGTMLLY